MVGSLDDVSPSGTAHKTVSPLKGLSHANPPLSREATFGLLRMHSHAFATARKYLPSTVK